MFNGKCAVVYFRELNIVRHDMHTPFFAIMANNMLLPRWVTI